SQTLPRTVALTLDHHVFGDHGVDDHMDVILAALATLARSLGSLGVGLTDHEHLLAGIHLGQALLDESERLGRLLGIVRVHLMRSEAVLHVVTLMAELVLALRRDTDMRRRLARTGRAPVLPDLEVRRLSRIIGLVIATLALAHLALLAVLLSEVEEVRGGGRDPRVLGVHLGDALLHPLLATGLRPDDVADRRGRRVSGDDLALHGRSPPRPAVESRHLLIDHRRHLHDGEKQTLLLVAQRSDLVLIESRRDSVACSAVARAGDLVEQMTLGSRLTLETSDGCTQIVPGLQHGVAQGTRSVDAGGDGRLATRVIISSHIRRRLNRDAAGRLHGRADETTERCSGRSQGGLDLPNTLEMRPLIQRQAGAHDLRKTLGLLGTHGNHTLGSQHNADVACRLCMPDPARTYSPGGR